MNGVYENHRPNMPPDSVFTYGLINIVRGARLRGALGRIEFPFEALSFRIHRGALNGFIELISEVARSSSPDRRTHRCEPPLDFLRLQLLRKWSHNELDEQ